MSWLQEIGRFFNDVTGVTASQTGQAIVNANEAEKQRLWQEIMFNLNNEYNTPMAQMQRARAAGLNPSLLYGQPIAESQAASGGAEASISAPTGNGFGAMLGLAGDIPTKLADIELKRANARLAQEKAETESSMRSARIDNLISATEANRASVQDAISKINQRIHQNALTDAERDNISFEQLYKSHVLSIDYSRLQNETRMTDASIDKLKADTELILAQKKVTNREYEEMIWTFAIRAAGLESQVHLNEAKTKEAYATASKLGFEQRRIEQLINIDTPKENYYSGTPNETGNPIAFEIRYSVGETIKALLGRL